MTKKNRLQKLLKLFTSDGTEVDFADFDKQVESLKKSLKEKIQIQTLNDVNNQLDKFQKRINFGPLQQTLESIKESIDKKLDEVSQEIETKSAESATLIASNNSSSKERAKELEAEIKELSLQLSTLEEVRKKDVSKLSRELSAIQEVEDRMDDFFIDVANRLDELEEPEEAVDYIKEVTPALDKLRIELLAKIAETSRGGSMNRQITVGNTDPLTKYTDINLKAGSNVTITTANNDTTKRVDITISSSGGGGSVIGTTRSITTLTVSSVIGTTSGVDQVYLANGGIRVTLPTAVGDTNLYTIKNIGTSSVLVDTQNAETIDNDSTIIMPVRYTSVDIISDSANWNIT